jgi:putative transposase
MKKYDLFRSGDNIIRILDIQDDRILMIDCVKHTMPVWRKFESVDSVLSESELLRVYSQCSGKELSVCTDNELLKATGFTSVDIDTMDAEQRKVMYERYTMITPILPFLSNEKMRSKLICSIAEEHQVSKQTIRNYLCLYLSYLDVTVLAPKKRKNERELSQDEKHMRWALNKFFYTTKKQSLMTAYTMMLKEKYCDAMGVLAEEYPSFYQFRYFYRKTRKLQNFYISRDGLKNYQRNNRPLIGEGVQEFAPAVGIGMLDATVCDIYLINEEGNLVGRPILTACIDAYSSLCCGYSLSWEGGVYSLRGLMLNIITDKVAWCKRYGISIEKEDWDCNGLPGTFVTDMGSEYKSENFEQIAELGVTVVNLPSYRPELKGLVEKFFDLLQGMYKKHLKGKGVIEPDYQERGAHDYRKDACLTIADFEKIILHCMIYYNSKRIIENFPYTEAMINAGVKPYASCIWEWGKSLIGANLIAVGSRELVLTLLPRTTGRFGRTGLKVNKLRYHCEGYTEQYLSGGNVTVAYNPEDVTSVWVVENGVYTEFTLIESRFQCKDLTEVQEMQDGQKIISKSEVRNNLQAQIDLAQHIEAIAGGISGHRDVHMKNIRNTRKKEQSRCHQDYMKEGSCYD